MPVALIDFRTLGTTNNATSENASEAIVTFIESVSDSQVEQPWSEDDGSLLEFAESHGFTPEYGCRGGQCGSCKAQLTSGKVSYGQEITTEVGDNEVLLCCGAVMGASVL
jgi:ferredoxin